MPHLAQRIRRKEIRRGWLLVEVIVAFGLIGTLAAVVMPLLVKNNRLLGQQRNHRLAVEELTNQLEMLTHFSAAEVDDQLKQLAPSQFIQERLKGVILTGKTATADLGVRIELQIDWQGRIANAEPVTLLGWALPESDADSNSLTSEVDEQASEEDRQ